MNSLNNLNDAPAVGQSIAARLRSECGLKLYLLICLNFWVYAPYLFLQRHHFFPTTTMPLSFFDRLMPFRPETVWIYLSIYCLMPIGPFLMQRRQQLLRYAAGIMLIGLIADTIFFFWPTTCPRPDAVGTNAIYQRLISVDNPFHACPSLHAAFAVYSAMCGAQIVRELRASWLCETGLWLWAFLILLATLTTKQHVVADLIAGSALGLGIHKCVFSQGIFWKTQKPDLQSVITNFKSNIP